MQTRGDQQRRAESVQRRLAVIVFMLVRMRAGRAHRIKIPVRDPEHAEASRDPRQGRAPVPEFGHFRQDEEYCYSHQNAAAERNDAARDGVHGAQPYPARGREDGDARNDERRDDKTCGEQRKLPSDVSFYRRK